jgi:hypothetical protein
LIQLERMENLHEELNKKLRSLQLNQLRQRKRRDGKKLLADDHPCKPPSSCVCGDQDEDCCLRSSNPSPAQQKTGDQTMNNSNAHLTAEITASFAKLATYLFIKRAR